MTTVRWVDEQWAEFVSSTYGIPVDAAVSMRTVTGIVSGDRRYVLKPFRDDRFDRPRIELLGRILERLDASGVSVAKVVRTKQGHFAARARGTWVSLQMWVTGRHTNMHHANERRALVSEVARLHALPIVVDQAERPFLRVTPVDVKYAKRARYFRDRVQRIEFADEEIANKMRHYAHRAELAAAALRQTNALRIAQRRDGMYGTLCHRDLAPHNAMYRDGSATLIDFDLAGMDVRSYDICQIINHTVYLLGWDERAVEDAVAVYESSYPLCPDNIELLYHLLSFPMLLVRELMEDGLDGIAMSRNPRLRWAIQIEDLRARWLQRSW